MMCAFGKNGIPKVAPVQISPDRSVFKGLEQELTNNIRILLLYHSW